MMVVHHGDLRTTAAQTSDAGDYTITATLHDPDGKLGNFAVIRNTGTLTIAEADLTVTVNDATKVSGAANPTFTGTITGIKNGDVIAPNYSTTATPVARHRGRTSSSSGSGAIPSFMQCSSSFGS